MSLKAILIDLGNVLVFFDRHRVVEHFASITGMSADVINFHLNKSADGQARLAAFEEGRIGQDEFQTLTQRVLGQSFPIKLFWAMHADLFSANYPVINLLHRVSSLYPDVRLLAVTNTDEVRLERMLLLAGIRFHEVIASCHVGSKKPDPRIYQAAIKRAGVPEQDCLFVDDVPENCVAAEKNCIPSHHYQTLAGLEGALGERGLNLKKGENS